MGQITINTPQGPALVYIEGDTISSEELDRLRKLAPPPEGETFDYTVVETDTTEDTSEPAPAAPTEEIDGEITMVLLRPHLELVMAEAEAC